MNIQETALYTYIVSQLNKYRKCEELFLPVTTVILRNSLYYFFSGSPEPISKYKSAVWTAPESGNYIPMTGMSAYPDTSEVNVKLFL